MNVYLAFFRFTHHCEKHDGSIQACICPCYSCSLSMHALFFQKWWSLPAGQCEVSNSWQCTLAFEEHQDKFSVLPRLANSPDLHLIEIMWEHLDRLVYVVDPYPLNLAQLTMVLESTSHNIPENTFRDLADSLPARLAKSDLQQTVIQAFERWLD
ncbi:transposable element Tcb1 transposase [Trichonephila clavipes]|nr:transposable element Tcb1 transposase [Trichonephila clavipes]